MTEAMGFARSWILVAVHARDEVGGRDLTHLPEALDSVNHALPTVQSLERGVRDLEVAGLVEVAEGRFYATAQGDEMVARTPAEAASCELKPLPARKSPSMTRESRRLRCRSLLKKPRTTYRDRSNARHQRGDAGSSQTT